MNLKPPPITSQFVYESSLFFHRESDSRYTIQHLKHQNACYKTLKRGFRVLYTDRLNAHLITMQSKDLHENFNIEPDNKECILKYCLIGFYFENWIT